MSPLVATIRNYVYPVQNRSQTLGRADPQALDFSQPTNNPVPTQNALGRQIHTNTKVIVVAASTNGLQGRWLQLANALFLA